MDSQKIKKLVLNNLAYVIFGYAGNIICFAFRTAEGKNASEKILPDLNNLGMAFVHIVPSFHPIDLLVAFIECWINADFPDDMEISSEFQEMKANQPNEEQKRLGAFDCKYHLAGKISAESNLQR